MNYKEEDLLIHDMLVKQFPKASPAMKIRLLAWCNLTSQLIHDYYCDDIPRGFIGSEHSDLFARVSIIVSALRMRLVKKKDFASDLYHIGS